MRIRPPIADFERPAVFLVNGLGDQLIALPAMRALGAIFPRGIQLLLGEGMYSFFYRDLPFGDPVRVWWHNYEQTTIDVERIARQAKPCDLFLCLATWPCPLATELAGKMGAQWTVGYFPIFDECVSVEESAHMFDHLFTIPRCLRPNLQFDDFSFAPRFSPAAEKAAKRFVDERVAPGERILYVHPETSSEKMWTPESFSWVVGRFLDAHPEFKVFITSVKRYPVDLGPHRRHMVWVDEHLELAMAMMRYADLFIGVDSCFLHAADLFRVPGVALFGPSDPRQWGFRLSARTRSILGKESMEMVGRTPVLEALLEVADLRSEVTGEVGSR